MFIPMWIIYALVSLYFTAGFMFAFNGALAPEGISVKGFLACMLIWPLFLRR